MRSKGRESPGQFHPSPRLLRVRGPVDCLLPHNGGARQSASKRSSGAPFQEACSTQVEQEANMCFLNPNKPQNWAVLGSDKSFNL